MRKGPLKRRDKSLEDLGELRLHDRPYECVGNPVKPADQLEKFGPLLIPLTLLLKDGGQQRVYQPLDGWVSGGVSFQLRQQRQARLVHRPEPALQDRRQ